MRRVAYSSVLFACASCAWASVFDWHALPALPQGVGGHFAGVVNGNVVVAGGTYFDGSMFEGGARQWPDSVYVLEPGAEAWDRRGHLPHSWAYGGSVSTPQGLLLLGGADDQTHFDYVLRLRLVDGGIVFEALPPLPVSCAYLSAALLGSTVYVAGGLAGPAETETLGTFWSFDLTTPDGYWQSLEPWPGPSRMLAVMAVQGGSLYLFSGLEKYTDAEGDAKQRFLADGYRYTPGKGWRVVAGPPRPVVGAPALAYGPSHVLVFGGNDGSTADQIQVLRDEHPGFPEDVLGYHVITDTWAIVGAMAASVIAAPAAPWQGGVVIAGGEDRPGHRTTAVMAGKARARAGLFTAADYTTLLLYFGVIVGIGVYFARREQSTEAFFLGGRRVPWWAVGLSIFGTSVSAITYLAIPAVAYAANWSTVLNNVGTLLIAPVVVLFYLQRFRRTAITTAYELLEERFNFLARVYGSVIFLLFQFGRIAIVLLLPAIALSTATGMNIYLCILTMGVLATLYTMLGGIEAVIWTDVLQAFVLMLGAILALVIIASRVDGGFGGIIAAGMDANKFYVADWRWTWTLDMVWIFILGNMFTMLYPMTADQTVVQRYLATESTKAAGKAVWTNALLTIPVSLLFFGLGTALWAYYRHHPQDLEPGLNNDAIMPLFIVQAFPPGLAGIVIAGVFAAAMSSLDSSLNSVATVLVHDYYRRWRPQITDRHALKAARWITVALGVIGTGMALTMAVLKTPQLFETWLRLLGLVGGGLAGMMALAMFTRRTTSAGALMGAAVSAVTVVYAAWFTELHYFLHGMIGFMVCFGVGYGSSWVLGRKG
jgi:solute:Na+ symporter, SSS family